MKKLITYMGVATKKVFASRSLHVLFLSLLVFFLILFSTVPFYSTIRDFASLPATHVGEVLVLVWNVMVGFFTENALSGVVYTLTIVALLSLNITFFVFFFRSLYVGVGFWKTIGSGFGGGILGILGGGCAACGTFVISYLLSLVGAQWIIFALPLEGKEFGIVGISMLIFSLAVISKRIAEENTV
ncbi:MAG TPA: hypothetical protein VJH55_03120 [Candidatus Paceibacterota bacterium]